MSPKPMQIRICDECGLNWQAHIAAAKARWVKAHPGAEDMPWENIAVSVTEADCKALECQL